MTGGADGGADGAPTERGRPVHLLFTCTANRVRSPLAAEIARSHVRRLGLDVEVRSAGLLEEGAPATADMIDTARRLGHDLTEHRSRRVNTARLAWADLIVTMTGQHVIDLVGVSAECRERAITLKEFAGTVERGAPLPRWTVAEVRSWAASATLRPLDQLLSGELDVADPIGRSKRVHRRAAAEIEALVDACFGGT